MGIWIRRQDGGLGKYTKFLPPIINREETIDPEVPFCTIFSEVLDVHIMGRYMNGALNIIGEYTSEAEAIQVLDMIEGVLGTQVVFRMPPSGFSKEG